MRSFSGLSIVIVISILLCSYLIVGQEIPEITAEELPGFVLNRNESFNGGSLWGYMNGGADIYLEYGFDILRVQEFAFEDETIKLEIFKMDDPIAAFGIYSIKTFRCEQSKVITTIDCLNRFQFQLLAGEYYIQMINDSGSEKASQAMKSIGETLLNQIDPEELKLPIRFLTDSLNFTLSEITMLKGILGIQDKAMNLAECFVDIHDYQVYYAKEPVDGGVVRYYEIVFNSPEKKYQFLAVNKDADLSIINEDNFSLLIQK